MKHSGIPLSSLPPKLRAQIERETYPMIPLVVPSFLAPKRLRQSSKEKNKLEQAVEDRLRQWFGPASKIRFQEITLKLANGLRYTPDFHVTNKEHRDLFFEAKGFMRDDAAAKIKMAARQFDHWVFILIWREKGQWHQQVMLP